MNTKSIIWSLLAGVVTLSAAATAAAAGGAEEAVIAAEHQVAKALQTNNAELFGSLMTDNTVSTDEQGTVEVGKAANLADFKTTTWTSFELTDMKVTMFGDTAIVIGTYASKGTSKGKPFDSRGRFTDTWVKLNGKWLCAADHNSQTKKQ